MAKGLFFFLLSAALPTALQAFSAGAPIFSVGVPGESNAATCIRCHSTFGTVNPDGAQRLRVETFHYKPGQTQTVRVSVSHPESVRWGFQITARQANDITKRAGEFVLSPQIRVRCTDTANGRDVTAASACPTDSLEFAGHNANSNRNGSNGTGAWEFEWTPPATDIGDVVFYVSGNAANGNNGLDGDRVYNNAQSPLRIEAEGRSCPNTTRPTLERMQNGASFGAEVAFNTLITLKGRDFAPSGTRRSPGIPDFRNGFPKEMACVAVEVAGQRIPLTYVQADQINAQLPTSIGTGSMQFRVILNPDRPNQLVSDTGTFTVLNYAPAFFTFNGRSVAAVFPDGTIAADPSVVAGARTVKAGDVLQLYATGLGPTEPVWQAGETPSRASALRDRLSITCGGVTVSAADITYAGIVPGSISGLYQINVRVPSTVAEGEIPVTMTVGGVTSPAGTTIPVRR